MKQIGRVLVIIIVALVYGWPAFATCTASLALTKYDDERIRFKATGTASSCPNNNAINLLVSYDGGPFGSNKNCFTSPCEMEWTDGFACLKGTHTETLLVTCGKALPDGSCGVPDENFGLETKSFSFDHTPSITNVETKADGGGSGYPTGSIHYHARDVAGNFIVTGEWLGGSSGVNCCFSVYPEGEFGNTADYWSPFYGSPDGSGSTMLLLTVTECNDKKASTVVNAVDNDCGCATGGGSQYSPSGPGPAACVGNPIRLSNGNMRMTERDPLPANEALFLGRTYDSRGVTGFFGNGWTGPFDARLRISQSQSLGTTFAEIRTPSNSKYLFQNVDGGWLQMWPRGTTPAVLSTGTGTYTLREPRSAIETIFDAASGRLLRARSRSLGGREAVISYVNGLPTRVEDSWGDWAWTIASDAANRISTITVDGTSLVWTYTYDASGNLASVTGPASSAWRTYAYTAQGLTEARDARGNLIESHAYGPNPYVTRATQSLSSQNDITNIEYLLPGRDDFEKITRTTSGNGATTDYYTRYIAGRPRTVQVVGHCATCGTNDAVYAYDGNTGQLLREQDARGFITVRTFDDSDRVTSIAGPYQPAGCDPLTDVNHCRQTPASLLTATLSPTISTLTTAFNSGDLTWTDVATLTTVASVLAPNQVRTTSAQLDPATGIVTQQVTTGQTGNPAQSVQYTTTTALYDGVEGAAFNPGGAFDAAWLNLPQPTGLRKSSDGPRTDVTDTTTLVYYPIDSAVPAAWRGRLAAIRNAAGHVTRFENYDVFGNAGRTVDPNGVVSESTFDSIGRLITSTLKAIPGCDTTADPLCATDIVSSRTYQPALGPLASTTTPRGGTTTYEYDDRGRTTATTRQVSATAYERIEYDYDPATGHKSAERYLGGHPGAWTVTGSDAFHYDSFARLSEIDHPDGSKIVYHYDGANNVISVQDERHTAPNTTYAYDPANRLAAVTQTLSSAPGGQIATAYAYDMLGNLTSVTDPNGNVTSYVYDDFGRMISQTSPVTGVTTYAYDPASNLTATTDANNGTTSRAYDALNRGTSAVSTGESTETTSWAYDGATSFGLGRLATMTDPTGSTTYRYDRRGALSSEQKAIGSATYTTGYQYDSDGNRSSMTYPSGRAVTYTFDLAGRPLTAAAGTTTFVSSATYLPFGPATQTVFGNGTTKTMTYNNRYRVLENKLTSAGGVLADYNYAEDPAGNITQIHDAADSTFSRDFGYDDLNRLVTANSGSSLWGAGTYQYDPMGNLLSSALGARTSSFAYVGTTPKLSSVTANGATQSVSYDPVGNEIQAEGLSSHYSPRNTLADAGLLSYSYDGRGVRAVTSIPASYLSSLQVTPTVLYTNQNAIGTVTLAAAAPAGGVVVHLGSSSPAFSVPATITVPEGGTSAVFGISQTTDAQAGTVTITASYLYTATATISLTAGPTMGILSINPSTVAGGVSATGTVILSAAAPAGGAPVLLTSDSSAATVPSQMTIPAGQTEGAFDIGTSAVASATVAHVTGNYNGTAAAVLNIVNGVSSLAASPTSLIGGANSTGTITLIGPAPAGGATVSLASSSPSVALVPSTIIVAEGSTAASFAITTSVVTTSITVTITASFVSSSAAASLTVNPCTLTTAPQPTIPSGDTVWFDDTLPAGMSFNDILFDTSQKASGTQSLHIHYGVGSYGEDSGYATPPYFQVLPGDRLVFYMLMNPCSPPREVEVTWHATGGIGGAYWGAALTGDESGKVAMGALPAAGGWVRMEVPASLMPGVEGSGVYLFELSRFDGEVWFDRFGRTGTCTLMTEVAQPTIPAGDTVWFDDTLPAGMSFNDIRFDTSQKASGTQSLHIHYGVGSYGEDSGYATPPYFQVLPGDRLVFYMLMNPCSPPREVEVTWHATGGIGGAYWGAALTGNETGKVAMGALPAAGGWVRMEVPASLFPGIEGSGVYLFELSRFDGEVWFDRFGRTGTCTPMTEVAQPTIPEGDTVWFDDTLPAGMSFNDIRFDTSQKASGTQSLHIHYGVGSYGEDSGYATPPYFQILPGDRLVFYMLMNPCSPPREVEVTWHATGGIGGAYWGAALTGNETGKVAMGALPAAGGWVRMEVPASLFPGIEGSGVYLFELSRFDGEVWFDRFGRTGTCTPMTEVAQPTIPAGDTVWFDDTLPAGMSFPDIPFDTSQKATGTRSLHIHYGTGSFGQDSGYTTAPYFQILPGDRLVFYMLMNPCSPPREVEVTWYASGGIGGAYWGAALTGDESGKVAMGGLPAAGGWVRMEIPASRFPGIEGSGLARIDLSRFDGEVWFDRFGTAPGSSGALSINPPRSMLAGVTNPRSNTVFRRLQNEWRRVFGLERVRPPLSLSVHAPIALSSSPKAHRYSLYTPELNLMAETEQTTAPTPAIAYEYIWFGGQPVAQFDTATNTTHWTFTDHLGTPILQTNASGSVDWRVEYEPYGTVNTLRVGAARHQALRLPGQEYDETSSNESYNIFRWYRTGWAKYTQSDPLELPTVPYGYASENPILSTDVLGLFDAGSAAAAARHGVAMCEEAGSALGGAVLGAIAIVMYAGDANPASFENQIKGCNPCKKKNCRPCIPPVGTLAYREDTNPKSPPHRGVPPPHWKLYEMNQNPYNCQCFWKPVPDNKGGFGASPPPPGTIPISTASGGGEW